MTPTYDVSHSGARFSRHRESTWRQNELGIYESISIGSLETKLNRAFLKIFSQTSGLGDISQGHVGETYAQFSPWFSLDSYRTIMSFSSLG
jgi:hypothetical protein